MLSRFWGSSKQRQKPQVDNRVSGKAAANVANRNLTATAIAADDIIDVDIIVPSPDPNFPVDTDDPAAWYRQGNLYRDAGKLDVALACYHKTIELQPHKQEAWTNLGWVLVGLKRLDEALAAYRQAIELEPEDADVWANHGWVLFQLRYYA